MIAYTTLLAAIRTTFERPRALRALRWVTGTVLVGLGARLALERR